jgi:hypothetical protein
VKNETKAGMLESKKTKPGFFGKKEVRFFLFYFMQVDGLSYNFEKFVTLL